MAPRLPAAAAAVQQDVESDQDVGVADRLRELIDLVLGSLDEPGADGAALARRAHFSRDHLDRLLAAATGETPVALRRRLLLERAAWQLRSGGAPAAEAGAGAGYASAAAFSRAFARAYGMPPGAFAAADRAIELDAPNGVHFHPPGGLLIPGGARAAGRPRPHRAPRRAPPRPHARAARGRRHAPGRRARAAAATRLRRRLVRGRGGERGGDGRAARVHARGLGRGDHRRARRPRRAPARRWRASTARRPASSASRSRIRDRGAWDDAFVDALCEPPQSFTYGGVLAHVLSYGAVRREALAAVLSDLGAPVPASGDPIEWEAARGRVGSPGARRARPPRLEAPRVGALRGRARRAGARGRRGRVPCRARRAVPRAPAVAAPARRARRLRRRAVVPARPRRARRPRRRARGAASASSSTASAGEPMAFVRFGAARFALGDADLRSTSTGSTRTAAGCSSRSPTPRAGARPTAAGATCSTPSRAPTWARTAAGSCSTSTSPTTRPARTTRAGPARSRRPRTGSPVAVRAGERAP